MTRLLAKIFISLTVENGIFLIVREQEQTDLLNSALISATYDFNSFNAGDYLPDESDSYYEIAFSMLNSLI